MNEKTQSKGSVERTEGYLGYVFDDMLHLGKSLKPLDGFDFDYYGIIADELGKLDRKVTVEFGSAPQTICFEANSISEIVSSIPSVAAIYDNPEGQGPAGGSGFIFAQVDGYSKEQTVFFAEKLRLQLDLDYEALVLEYETP